MDWLVRATSRRRPIMDSGPGGATASCTSTPSTTPPPEERLNGINRTRWGGSTPNHPAALRLGTQMGSDSPGQHEYIFSTKSHALLPKTMRDTPEEGSSSSRGDARRTLRWLWNFLPDEVWDAETTRNPATAARQPRAPSAGVPLEEYDSDLLGTNRPTRMPPGLTQSPRREAPARAGPRSNRIPGQGRRQLLKPH